MKKILTENYQTDRTITLLEIFELLNEKFGLVYGKDITYDWDRVMERGYRTYRFKIVESDDLRHEDGIKREQEIALEEAEAQSKYTILGELK